MELSAGYNRMDVSAFAMLMKTMSEQKLINLGGGSPDPALLPGKELALLSKRLLEEQGERLLQYGPARGLPELLDAYGNYLWKYRGIESQTKDLLVVSGGTQGISLVSEALLSPGDTMLVESPTFMVIYPILQRLNVRCVPVCTDKDGVVLSDLKEKAEKYRPKAFYLIPTFQNPSGTVFSMSRRSELLSLSRELDFYIIEDDPYYDLRYEGESLPTLKSLGEKDKVIEISSFSKLIAPGLRIGGLCGPEKLISAALAIKQSTDMHSSNLAQALCAAYMESPSFAPHIKSICSSNRKKLAHMADGIKTHFPAGTTFEKPEGGLFMWVSLPQVLRTEALLQKALTQYQVAYIPGSYFFASGCSQGNFLRLNFAAVTLEEAAQGLSRLGSLFEGR